MGYKLRTVHTLKAKINATQIRPCASTDALRVPPLRSQKPWNSTLPLALANPANDVVLLVCMANSYVMLIMPLGLRA